MSRLSEIYEGWKNFTFQNPKVEAEAKRRMEICVKCKELNSRFRTPDNSGKNNIHLGLLIETNGVFNTGGTLYINGFTYTAADILVKDPNKSNLTIEQNFNSAFIGGIQKLRIYDRAFTAPEVLHNALMEAKTKPNMFVSKGGRIIYS